MTTAESPFPDNSKEAVLFQIILLLISLQPGQGTRVSDPHPMRIRIQLEISIRIQSASLMRIRNKASLDPDPH
jgi:hypothetical protein